MRIVSLLPAATEIVVALGMVDSLVGISHECDFPAEVAAKPRVTRCLFDATELASDEIDRRVAETLASSGTIYALDESLLRALAPDVILTQRLCDVCAVGHGSVARMAAKLPGAPRIVNLEPSSLTDVFADIRATATAIGAVEAGNRLVSGLAERIDLIRERTEAAPHRPRCFLMEWIDPPYSAGHWNPELVKIAGAEDPLGHAGQDSARIQWKSALAAQPDFLVLSCCGYSIERMRRDLPILKECAGWTDLPAVRTGHVYAVDGNAYFTRPGPRLIEGLEILAGILHPEFFPQFAPDRWPETAVSRID